MAARPKIVVTAFGEVELHEKPHRRVQSGLKAYDIFRNGICVGAVEGFYPTFEKKIPGKRYVASRWQSKRVHWVPVYTGMRNRFRDYQETRVRAIEHAIMGWEREQERLHVRAEESK